MSARLSSDLSRAMSQSSQSRQSSSQGQHIDLIHRHSSSSRNPNPDIFSDDYSLGRIESEDSHSHRDPSISSVGSSSSAFYSNRLAHESANPSNTRDSLENPFGDAARVSFEDTPHIQSPPRKGGANRDSLASSVNTTPSITQRSQSSSSRFSLPPRALSPYRGATGPSHPYAMYPQVGVGRSPSVTTTSSIRPPERPLGEVNGPQHPYSMYPQNVVVEEGLDDPVIPVGFPGHSQAYRRAPGRADDDIADIIGPDGHTEQLPPYSLFPDGVIPKDEDDSPEHGAGADATADDDHHPIAYDGPPASGTSSRTLMSERPAAPTAAAAAENRPAPAPPAAAAAASQAVLDEKAPGRGVKRIVCCGLPIWTLVLMAVVMVVCAVVGGVIGGVLGAKKATDAGQGQSSSSPPLVTITATPGMDATPMSSIPQGIPPLPTGRYLLPVSAKNRSSLCVSDSDYKYAWDCMDNDDLVVDISEADKQHSVTFQNDSTPGPSYKYGPQAPYFHSDTKSLSLVRDTNNYNLGPAFFFYALFDKLVIVGEDAFPTDAASKRSVLGSDIFGRSEQAARAGDQPWFCWWNSTIMEFFLYLNETTEESRGTATSSAASYPTFSSGSTSSSKTQAIPHYPRKVKMEEKRNYPGANRPYCQQMSVSDDGTISPLSTNTINISEVEPSPTPTVVGYIGSPSAETYAAKTYYGSSCYCVSLSD